ncbi:hypothetical protein EWM64_g135 [Hericium alpestre]|uniref:VWFA domain-containing protein n=1 Tax=Hericium alpestre TaxID=135208 RepID=A0A4Z0ABB0_9AGAM|nr:hypothetical protein EWM64_g135 [Hericium alpestre]
MKDDDSPILRQAIKIADDVVASIHQVSSDTVERKTRELQENGWDEISFALRLHKLARFLYNSCVHGFNISIIQVVTGWILEGLRDIPDSLLFVREKVEALQRLVTPTSGLGLGEIWATFRSSSAAPSPCLLQLEALAINSAAESRIYQLRGHVVDLLALEALPNAGDDSGRTLEITIEDIRKRLIESSHESVVQSNHVKDDRMLLIRELGVLARLHVGQQDNITDTARLLDAACQDPEGPLARFIPYRHAVWEVEAGKLTTMTMAALQISWLRALWNVDALHGPVILIEPTQLILTVAKCDWTNVTLRSSKRYQSDLHRHAKFILMASGSQVSRTEELVSFCYQTLLTLSSCFLDSFEETTRTKLQQATQEFRRLYSFSDLVNLLQESSHPQFSSTSMQLLGAPSALFDSSASESDAVLAVGHFLICIAQFFIELYVPNTPVDPSANQQCAADFWNGEQARIAEELRLHSELEVRETGEMRNGMTEYLRQGLEDAQGHLDGIPPIPKGCRRDASRLTAFWAEVSQFLSAVVATAKLNALLDLIKSGDAVASMREHVVQESISGFCQRLDTAYPEFRDLSSPLQWALLHMKLGLRLLAHASTTIDKGLDTFAKALVIFPSVRSAQVLGSSPDANSVLGSQEAFKTVLLRMASLTLEVDIGLEFSSQIQKIHALYEQAVRLWSIDRSKEAEADKAAASLYRGGATNNEAVPDSLLEEREFLELFPSFDDAAEDMDDHRAEDDMSRTKTLVDASLAEQLVDLHLRILTFQDRAGHLSSDTFSEFFDIRVIIEKAILEQNAGQLLESLDQSSTAHQLNLLKERFTSLETHSGSRARPYNFYLDPNVPEVQKASKLIEAMEGRLQTLIQEWPDQMVLQNLRDRCGQIMTTSLHSPVAKVLSMLEQLLLQTEDWEMFANRDNSLKDHRQALTTQIVEWRRLELSSWQGLLETQLITFEHGAFDWWFRLYDLVVRGPLGAVDLEEDIDGTEEYMERFVPLIDQFIKSSPMGQFRRRMDLLRSFEILLKHLSASMMAQEQFILERVLRILTNTRDYYSQYANRISRSFAMQRNALEKEIKGFIKLASWKDVNVHALKASATRTHHQLYKCIRKFREIMRQPIDSLFQLEPAGNTEGTPSFNSLPLRGEDDAAVSEFPARSKSANAPRHLQQLPQTYKKYQRLLHAQIGSFIRSRPFQHVDSLAGEIIEVSHSLSSIAIASDIPKEKQQKQAKALLVRKRKAWSDLLKELKRVGFAVNVKPEVLHQQQNERWLLEQAVISSSPADTSDSEKMERYWLRLRGLLPGVRATLADHHSDIGTRELQRGVMLLESGLSIALDTRSRLASLTSSYERFINVTRRLRMLRQTSKVAISGDESLSRVLRLKDFLCRCCHALFEAGQQLEAFGTLPSAQPIPATLSEELSVLMASTETRRDKLSEAVNNMRLTGTPLLLEDEYRDVQDSHAHVLHVLTQLRSWEEEHGYLRDILSPIRAWAESETGSLSPLEATQVSSDIVDADHVIDTFLTIVQSVLAKIPAEADSTESPDQDKYVKDTSRVIEQLSGALRVDSVLDTLDSAVTQLATASPETIQLNVARFLPFVEHYGTLVEEHVQVLTKWTGSLFKLEYVLCSIIHTIAMQGFCKPPDIEEASEGDEGVETSGGTGLGEGTGKENVSKEIEDESQVEGLKDEDQGAQNERNKDEDDQEKDNTIEMGQDFEGELEDVPDEGEEGEDENDDDAEEAEEPEEQIGDVGENDEGKVDEKLWGDEKGPEENEGKTNEDHSTSKGDESEMVAKEGGKKEKDKTPKEDKAGEESKEENIDEPMPEDGADEDAGALPEPNEAGAPIDDYVQDAETLDLPEDLDMGAEDEQDDALGQDDEMDLGDDGYDEEPAQDGEEETEHRPASPDAADDEGAEDDSQNDKFAQATEDDANPEGEMSEEGIAQPDLQQGDGSAADTTPEVSKNTSERDAANTGEGGGTQGAAGNDAGAGDQANQDAESKAENGEQQPGAPEETSTGAGGATTGAEQGNAASQDTPQTGLSSNPLRSLGDALKEIRQRFDDILESAGETGDLPMPQAADSAEPAQLEYLHPDDADQNMQALGPAGSEEVAKLSELKLVDEEASAGPDIPMDIDDQTLPEQLANPPPISSLQSDPTTEAFQEDVESALTQHQVRSQQPAQTQPDPSLDLHAPKVDVDMEEPEGQEIIEAELRRWQAEGQPKQGAEHLWRQYESLTHDLSFALCEQLRLILEPTLATRLKGDYRTGKRLNMKKIIPYIASEYTKDKIWLRRTRPSQREYQVLIALDDSRSMAESHSVHLAYETLALVSKALSRLEVGDIGIAKFGETVDVLHGFDEGPFTDQAGMQVMSAFGFHQKATDVLSMVEASLKILESARDRRSTGSSSAADLWQLEIIISDGICQDHDKLRTVLRKAEEQRVMVVFIVIDSLHSNTAAATGSSTTGEGAHNNSILSMNQVAYKNVDGKMELQMQRYLDSFPFEYYVVLRSVEALPEVLSSTLKQFFERISED